MHRFIIDSHDRLQQLNVCYMWISFDFRILNEKARIATRATLHFGSPRLPLERYKAK